MSQRYLYLVRGLPGAGKTTFAKNVAKDNDCVIAADDFMVDEKGNYKFDSSRLQEVHDKCARAVSDAMEKGTLRIFVHNTLTEK